MDVFLFIQIVCNFFYLCFVVFIMQAFLYLFG